MRPAVQLALFSLLAAAEVFACGLNGSAKPGWSVPTDARFIKAIGVSQGFGDPGLPGDVTARVVTYKRGFVFAAPDGKGRWELRNVKKLYYRERMFAVIGDAYFISEAGNYAGCTSPIAIYDEHCSGRLDSLEQIDPIVRSAGAPAPKRYHLPACFAEKEV